MAITRMRFLQGCRFRKLDSSIAMVESAKDRIRDNVAEPLDGPSAGRILPERNVGPNLIVIGVVFSEDSPKGVGVEHQQASRAAEFRHRALSEPYVSLSTHTAPSIRPFAYKSRQWGKSPGVRLTTPASHVRARFGRCLRCLNFR